MAATYTPIASITLGATVSSVTFSSIPQTYTDLVCVVEGRGTRADYDDEVKIQFNSDTATNYSSTLLSGSGSAASSSRTTSASLIIGRIVGNSATAGVRSNMILNIMNYANTTTYKTVLERLNEPPSGGADYGVALIAGLWRSTAAISTLTLTTTSGSFSSGCNFNLYGILGANA
jgi:hypothetical protein